MNLVLVGLSHHTAPLSVRERVTLPPSSLSDSLRLVHAKAEETVLLSTCNRTELYAVSAETEPAVLFEAIFPEEGPGLRRYLFSYDEAQTADHLFRVAAGLDSLLIGESEILGQVRQAWEAAHDARVTGPITSRLFQRALAIGKQVRTETDLGRFPASTASAAVSIARRTFGQDLSDCTILLIGAGEVGQSVARCFIESKAKRLLVANHRSERALELIGRYDGVPVPWPITPPVLAQADIIVSCTSAPTVILEAQKVSEALALRDGKPLHIIDLAVPRDVHADVGNLPGAYLHNLDDLRVVAEQSLVKRKRTLPTVEAMVEAETRRFGGWLQERTTFSTIRALRGEAEKIRTAETGWALAQLMHLSARDRGLVEALATRLTNKLIHAPTVALRRAARNGRATEYRQLVEEMFGPQSAEEGTHAIRRPEG